MLSHVIYCFDSENAVEKGVGKEAGGCVRMAQANSPAKQCFQRFFYLSVQTSSLEPFKKPIQFSFWLGLNRICMQVELLIYYVPGGAGTNLW